MKNKNMKMKPWKMKTWKGPYEKIKMKIVNNENTKR